MEEKTSRKETVKKIVAAIAGASIWEVLHNAIAHTTPSGLGFIAKLGVSFGGIVLTGIVGDAATKYTDNLVDKCMPDPNDEDSEEIEEEEV